MAKTPGPGPGTPWSGIMAAVTSPAADASAPSWIRFPTFGAATVVALVPLVVAARAAVAGWIPIGDEAIVVARSMDTLSRHPPLIGQWSSLSGGSEPAVHQLGPLQFWILGVIERLWAPSPVGALIGSALITSGAFATFLVIAWRRRGLSGLSIATTALAILAFALGPEALRAPFNPTAAAMGFIGFAATAWAVVDRDTRWLPVATFFASLSVQSHFTFVFPVAFGSVVLAVAVLADLIRSRRRHVPAMVTTGTWIATAATALVCWAGPIIDQIGGTGNLGAVLSAGSTGAGPSGPRLALYRLVTQLQIPPLWTKHPFDGATVFETYGRSGPVRPGLWALITAGLVVAFIAVGLVRARRQGQRVTLALGAVTVASLLGAFTTTWLLPATPIASYSTVNQLVWWPVGMLTWFLVADLFVTACRARIPREAFARIGTVASAAIAAAVIVVASTVIIRGTPTNDPGSVLFGQVDTIARTAREVCTRQGGSVEVRSQGALGFTSTPGVIAMLRLASCDVHVEDPSLYGASYAPRAGNRATLLISSTALTDPGLELVAVYDGHHQGARWRAYRRGGTLVPRDPSAFVYLDRG